MGGNLQNVVFRPHWLLRVLAPFRICLPEPPTHQLAPTCWMRIGARVGLLLPAKAWGKAWQASVYSKQACRLGQSPLPVLHKQGPPGTCTKADIQHERPCRMDESSVKLTACLLRSCAVQ